MDKDYQEGWEYAEENYSGCVLMLMLPEYNKTWNKMFEGKSKEFIRGMNEYMIERLKDSDVEHSDLNGAVLSTIKI